MMNRPTIHGAAFALMLFPVAACARPADQQTVPSDRTGAAPAGMTLQAYVQRHGHRPMVDDTDGDGKVSRAEFVATAKTGKGDPARRFAKIDRNGDGLMDKAEINAMLTQRFRRLDRNGDGVLRPDERTAAHHGKGGAGDGAAS